ncbi:MAG: glycoside hydrolase family 47 protein [Acidobacteriota bacterium]|nr:glycoside hydrolase family 47 protein [Acidobacteriota bacterium]
MTKEKSDSMQSFLFAETLKYYYLLSFRRRKLWISKNSYSIPKRIQSERLGNRIFRRIKRRTESLEHESLN